MDDDAAMMQMEGKVKVKEKKVETKAME